MPILLASQYKELIGEDDPVFRANRIYDKIQKLQTELYDAPDINAQPYLTDPQIMADFEVMVGRIKSFIRTASNVPNVNPQYLLEELTTEYNNLAMFYQYNLINRLTTNPILRRKTYQILDDLRDLIVGFEPNYKQIYQLNHIVDNINSKNLQPMQNIKNVGAPQAGVPPEVQQGVPPYHPGDNPGFRHYDESKVMYMDAKGNFTDRDGKKILRGNVPQDAIIINTRRSQPRAQSPAPQEAPEASGEQEASEAPPGQLLLEDNPRLIRRLINTAKRGSKSAISTLKSLASRGSQIAKDFIITMQETHPYFIDTEEPEVQDVGEPEAQDAGEIQEPETQQIVPYKRRILTQEEVNEMPFSAYTKYMQKISDDDKRKMPVHPEIRQRYEETGRRLRQIQDILPRITDETQRKNVQRELKRAKAHYRSLKRTDTEGYETAEEEQIGSAKPKKKVSNTKLKKLLKSLK